MIIFFTFMSIHDINLSVTSTPCTYGYLALNLVCLGNYEKTLLLLLLLLLLVVVVVVVVVVVAVVVGGGGGGGGGVASAVVVKI